MNGHENREEALRDLSGLLLCCVIARNKYPLALGSYRLADLLLDVFEELPKHHFDRLSAHQIVRHLIAPTQISIKSIGQVGLAARISQVEARVCSPEWQQPKY